MYVPNEILLQVLCLLDKGDLKKARLVSKLWRSCASESLFDTLYVSTQDEDLHIFKAVTQDPLLSRCVRTLEYNSVAFDTTCSLSDYVSRLWDQVSLMVRRDPKGQQEHFDSSDPDVNRLVDLLRKRPKSGSIKITAYETEAQKICAGMHFVQEGYADWKRRAEWQMALKASKRFERDLIQGLRNLTRLDSVGLIGSWPFLGTRLSSTANLPKICDSSPLARQWNIFQAFPLNWYWGPNTGGHDFPQGIVEFRTFTTALAIAERRPREFLCCDTIPSDAFDLDENSEKPPTWLSCLDAYRHLHCLVLNLATYGDEPDLRGQEKLKGLQLLLSNAKNLQHLELTLPEDYENPSEQVKLFRYDKKFPSSAQWPRLTHLSVQNLSLHMKDFIQLFSLSAMGNLNHLEISNIGLLSGTWEAAIEILKYTAEGLETFLILEYSFLYDGSPERRQLVSEGDDHQKIFFEKIQEYVVNGREDRDLRHPCLLSGDPNENSLEYLRDARECCEKTGADSSVLEKLDTYINYATAMYRAS